ncbi:MAG: phytanoyl-CoA dioxygenase family protein [Novosphingobium sp.]|nr:phytanoyl-CoA dioxygenase family protein [Novosphingobium sp.]
MGAPGLSFGSDGAAHFPGFAAAELDSLVDLLSRWPSGKPGVRIAGDPAIAELLGSESTFGRLAGDLTGQCSRAVRAILFDKSDSANWALGWHQDRTIAVKERLEMPGFGPWTVKQGIPHVTPPFGLIERMVSLRIHVDRVDGTNGPLQVALGTHRTGYIANSDTGKFANRSKVLACLAEPGDVWAYASPILHSSRAAAPGRRRRVLQVDYSPDELPDGMDWLGL